MGRGSTVGTATCYGLDGLGIESCWGDKIFCTRLDQPSGLPIGYQIFPRVNQLECGIDNPLQSSADVKETVKRCQGSTYNYTMSASLYVLSNSLSS